MNALQHFKLDKWFKKSFPADVQKYLTDVCPVFVAPADNSPCGSYWLASTLSCYSKKDNSDIVQTVVAEIIELFNADSKKMSVNDMHFFYSHVISSCYKFRDTWAGELVRELCEKSVLLAPAAAKTMGPYMPEHVGYNTLIAIEKKDKNWPRVLELAQLASSQGWAGKFDAWAAEAEKNLKN